jgi:hypothetical protein
MAIYTYTNDFASVFIVGKKYATTISEHRRSESLAGCTDFDNKQVRHQRGEIRKKFFKISEIAVL